MTMHFRMIRNAQSVAWADVPQVEVENFLADLTQRVSQGGRLVALTGLQRVDTRVETLAVVADDAAGELGLLRTTLRDAYPALTPHCPAAHHFERELHEQWGACPEGHPWLKPVRFPAGEGRPQIGRPELFRVEGAEVHEVGVGPVHAGVIEPGHFRFACHGEEVLHLEISLGYQHRGVERALVGGPDRRTIHYMETVAGDTSVGHTLAYCQAVEALANIALVPQALRLRAVALELERIANHIGDLGALAGDVGYLPTASTCGGLRGDVLNLTAMLCGSRLGRGLVRPGGLGLAPPGPDQLAELWERLAQVCRDAVCAARLMRGSSSARARFERIGVVETADARALGMVGPAARASGIDIDARRDHSTGAYREHTVEVTLGSSGDAFARAKQRELEIQVSAQLLDAMLANLGRDDSEPVAGLPGLPHGPGRRNDHIKTPRVPTLGL